MKKSLVILIFGLISNTFSQDIVTNQQILEKLDRLEVKINGIDVKVTWLEAKVEEGQKSLQKQIDDLRNLLYVILVGMFALIGFVLWDRRTALAPAVREMETVKKRDEKIIRILEEYSLIEPKLAAIMRNVAL